MCLRELEIMDNNLCQAHNFWLHYNEHKIIYIFKLDNFVKFAILIQACCGFNKLF